MIRTRKQYAHEWYERTKAPLKGHRNARKTHCPRGHAYTPENIYRHPIDKTRACKACSRERKRIWTLKQKQLNPCVTAKNPN